MFGRQIALDQFIRQSFSFGDHGMRPDVSLAHNVDRGKSDPEGDCKELRRTQVSYSLGGKEHADHRTCGCNAPQKRKSRAASIRNAAGCHAHEASTPRVRAKQEEAIAQDRRKNFVDANCSR
jgi:hypothetical protein